MSKLISGRSFDCEFEGEIFKLRVLSGEQQDRLIEISNNTARTPAERDEAFALAVISHPWEGTLRSVLSDLDCWQLVRLCIEGTYLKADERKKFLSQPASVAEQSATDASTAT